jgi:PAS domain S-box-containing protein
MESHAAKDEWLRLMMEHCPAVLWTTDEASRLTSLGGTRLASYGVDPSSRIGMTIAECFGTSDPAFGPVAAHLRALSGESVSFRFRWRDRAFECQVCPLTRKDQIHRGCIGVAVDVTERDRAHEQLAVAEREAHLGSWEWDLAGNQVSWSPELYRIYGIAPSEFGATYQAFLSQCVPEDAERVQKVIGEATRNPGPFRFQHRVYGHGGTVRILDTLGDVLVDRKGRPVRLIGTCRDVTRQRRAEEERNRAMSLLQATLESTADGILVVDTDGRIVSYNERFASMWRIPKVLLESHDDHRVLGFALEQLIDPDAFHARVQLLYAQPGVEAFDVLRFKDGRVFERWSQPQVLEGKVVGRVWSFRDVTERYKLEDERARLLDQERAARTQAESFLSVASHELRTPLTSLQLGVQGLLAGVYGGRPVDDNHPLARPLRSIERQARRLGRLIDDLLDVTRISSGRLELDLHEVDLSEVVLQVLARYEDEIARIGCVVTTSVPGAVTGRWDGARLEQVVSNLLSNALRYGAGRPIELRVTSTPERAALTVEDHGTGIPPERQRRLFERFERGGASRSYGGLGLGLYIVRNIVARLGGTVRVSSTPGVGSTFTVELPRGGPDA